MNYFIVYSNEDTAVGIDGPMSKEDALKRYEEKYYGNLKIKNTPPDHQGYYDGGGIMIIHGEVVIPKPIQVVTKYEF